MNFTPRAAAALLPPASMALKYGMPTICGTKATLFISAACAWLRANTPKPVAISERFMSRNMMSVFLE
jgi:hypothetical protein